MMSIAKRYEKRGRAYVSGYRTDDQQTTFKRGLLANVDRPGKAT